MHISLPLDTSSNKFLTKRNKIAKNTKIFKIYNEDIQEIQLR